jgi:hypothetical protein
MPTNRLNRSSQTGPSDSKDKGPGIFRVQISVCDNEKGSLGPGQVLIPYNRVKDVCCEELLAVGVHSGSRLDHFTGFKELQTQFGRRFFI